MNDVLAVEDDRDVRIIVAALLAMQGILQRIACHNGEALACVWRTRSAVVLLDMHIPE
jgi:FixJ family two-component response regulator